MIVLELARRLVRRMGYDVVRFDVRKHPTAHLQNLLQWERIDAILDVGANIGQFGQRMRKLGFRGALVSFEPQAEAFAKLSERAAADDLWRAMQLGPGADDYQGAINLAGNSQSSSLRAMLPRHEQSAPQSRYVGAEDIEIRALDTVMAEIGSPGERLFLKLDTQGFERDVLQGARETLTRVHLVQLEMSLVPLYDGETLFSGLHDLLGELGFVMVDLRTGFWDRDTGQILQVDGLFRRGNGARP